MSKTLLEKLAEIQKELKAPKGQFNAFGKYNYRSCEDILSAAKPLCNERGCALLITDTIIHAEGRFYVKAVAMVRDADNEISVSAFAREADHKKGMDEAQVTGSASSYARKYALNGLFAIDDTKDADTRDNSQNTTYKGRTNNIPNKESKKVTDGQLKRLFAIVSGSQYEMEQVKAYMVKAFKVESSKELNMSQYDILCAAIENGGLE